MNDCNSFIYILRLQVSKLFSRALVRISDFDDHGDELMLFRLKCERIGDKLIFICVVKAEETILNS